MSEKQKLLFTEETLKQVPIFFRFLTGQETKDVQEFRHGTHYSTCDRYRSTQFMRGEYYKPIVTLTLGGQDLLSKTTTDHG
ncbi:MAG TPA: hypothetical protein VI233_12015 [Puia sp.]